MTEPNQTTRTEQDTTPKLLRLKAGVDLWVLR